MDCKHCDVQHVRVRQCESEDVVVGSNLIRDMDVCNFSGLVGLRVWKSNKVEHVTERLSRNVCK
jgi:hypothetical protein